LVLRRADHISTEIAALSGVSKKTARRIAAEAPVTNVDNVAGEFSQHDFGEVRVTYQDGTETKVHCFASRQYSRWVESPLDFLEAPEAYSCSKLETSSL
jgi:hypothetical protein